MSTTSTPPPAPRTWAHGTLPWLEEADRLTGTAPRTRVIVDNDFAGDPDDLFQLAHHLLVEGTEVRGVVVSRLREDDPWNRTGSSVRAGRERVEGLLGAMRGVTGVGLHDGERPPCTSWPAGRWATSPAPTGPSPPSPSA